MIQKLILATHNKGKVREFDVLLKGLVGKVVSAGELGLAEPEETGATFTENAILKAKAAMEATGLPALADDSGMEAYALNGEPGIYSARWAGPEKDFAMAMETVNAKLEGMTDRRGAFVAVLALCYPDGRTETFEGRAEGELCWPPRGSGGFGYDPMFMPDGESRTFGEMTSDEKHAISHRAKAVSKLIDYLQKNG